MDLVKVQKVVLVVRGAVVVLESLMMVVLAANKVVATRKVSEVYLASLSCL